MAEENNTLQINPTKPTIIDFDVMISGLENIAPSVRFVIHKVRDDVDWMFQCVKLEGTKWQVSFPSFEDIKLNSCKFSVEVIVDEFYFKPAEGEILFVSSNVSFTPKSGVKPNVTASFKVKQEEKPKKPTKKKVDEASGGPEVTGQFAPNNDLLKPEEDPEDTQGKVKTAQAEVDDQFIDKSRLDDITDEMVPGEGEQYPQEDEKEDEDEFDPRKVAETIIRSTVSPISPSSKRGSLFQRDASGKIIVPGLESPSQKQRLSEKEQRVREILGK